MNTMKTKQEKIIEKTFKALIGERSVVTVMTDDEVLYGVFNNAEALNEKIASIKSQPTSVVATINALGEDAVNIVEPKPHKEIVAALTKENTLSTNKITHTVKSFYGYQWIEVATADANTARLVTDVLTSTHYPYRLSSDGYLTITRKDGSVSVFLRVMLSRDDIEKADFTNKLGFQLTTFIQRDIRASVAVAIDLMDVDSIDTDGFKFNRPYASAVFRDALSAFGKLESSEDCEAMEALIKERYIPKENNTKEAGYLKKGGYHFYHTLFGDTVKAIIRHYNGTEYMYYDMSQKGNTKSHTFDEFRKYFMPNKDEVKGVVTEKNIQQGNSRLTEKGKAFEKHNEENKKEKYFKPSGVRRIPRTEAINVKTGFKKLDEATRGGLEVGHMTIITGYSGHGKSTAVNEIVSNCINEGHSVFLCSSELHNIYVLENLDKMALGFKSINGHNTLIPVVKNGYTDYVPNDIFFPALDEWRKNLSIYNNARGLDIDKILEAAEESIEKEKTDIVIIDNLMSIDINANSTDKYDKQKEFVKRLKTLAMLKGVHVILVCHPRKEDKTNLIGQYDIAGSSDITNYFSTIVAFGRTVPSFRELYKKKFGVEWEDAEGATQNGETASGYYAILKSRTGGAIDEFYPLFFNKMTGRLTDVAGDVQPYKWEDIFADAMDEIGKFKRENNNQNPEEVLSEVAYETYKALQADNQMMIDTYEDNTTSQYAFGLNEFDVA